LALHRSHSTAHQCARVGQHTLVLLQVIQVRTSGSHERDVTSTQSHKAPFFGNSPACDVLIVMPVVSLALCLGHCVCVGCQCFRISMGIADAAALTLMIGILSRSSLQDQSIVAVSGHAGHEVRKDMAYLVLGEMALRLPGPGGSAPRAQRLGKKRESGYKWCTLPVSEQLKAWSLVLERGTAPPLHTP
jgi:hypothetical protein